MDTQLAETLYYLADAGGFKKVPNAFGVENSTVLVIVRDVCQIIPKYVGPECTV